MAINSVALAGNLTRDAQLKATQSGGSVLSFSIAVNERKKGADGWEDETSYFEVVMFGKRAESVSAYLVKGTKVAIVGRLHQNRYESKDGSKRSAVEVIADELEFMSRRDAVTEAPKPRAPQPAPITQPAPQQSAAIADEDIPF